MGYCNIDHTLASVQKKLEEQSSFLPENIVQEFQTFLTKTLTQEQLNEAFHVLKKYDLLSEEERVERNQAIHNLMKGDF